MPPSCQEQIEKNLIYTVAFDPPGSRSSSLMAKLLVSSLLRTVFSGDIYVFRNSPRPLFPVARAGLREFTVTTHPYSGSEGVKECLLEALRWRFKARHHIDSSRYQRILYLDADCLALRNIDHLFASEAAITVQSERQRPITDDVFNGYLDFLEIEQLKQDGVNAGTISFKAKEFQNITRKWEQIFQSAPVQHGLFRDQTALNRLILDTHLKVDSFERNEIAFPFHLNPNYLEYSRAALLHFVGGTQKQKLKLAFALFMANFYHEDSGMFLNFLES